MAGATETTSAVGRRYRIDRRIGSGSYGDVFAALDLERGTEIALKRLHRADARGLYRFKKEFRSLARLSHPNLVTLYELFVEEDSWYLAMELVEGEPITSSLRQDARVVSAVAGGSLMATLPSAFDPSPDATRFDPRPTPLDRSGDAALAGTLEGLDSERPVEAVPHDLDWARVRRVFAGVAEALTALHGAGMLHRDLKPHNVLVTPRSRPVVLDFGLVTERGGSGAGERSGLVVGTPNYMAPEQATGRAAGPASDLYSLGVMLYEVLAGRLPYEHENLMTLLWKKVRGGAPGVRTLNPRIPEALADLCDALLAVDPDRRPDAAHVARGLGGGAAPAVSDSMLPAAALVGRDVELAQLREAFRESCEHAEPRLVVLEGDSGMGKSAVATALLTEVERRDGAMAFPGRCYEQDFVPYKAVDGLVDELSGHLARFGAPQLRELLPPHAAELARLFPVFAGVVPKGVAVEPLLEDSVAARRRGFRALRELLFRLGRDRPLVVFIDDIQWGDVQSADILLDLMRGPAAPPITWVLALRSDERDSPLPRTLLERLLHEDTIDSRRIVLRPLPPAACADLAGRILASNDGGLAERIAREAGGHPLFVEELARHARDAGTLDLPRTSEGTPDSDDRRVLLGRVLGERLLQLPDPSRRLLEVVAIAGMPIAPGTAHRAAGLELQDRRIEHRLLSARLVRTQHSGEADRLAPYHGRIREAILAALEPARRRSLHRAVGDALAADGAPARLLVPHYAEAGDLRTAALHARRAGEEASRALAFPEAVSLFERALGWLEASGGTLAERTEVRRALAEALVAVGRCRDGARLYESLARGRSNPVERARLELAAAQAYFTTGATREGDAVLRSLSDLLGLGAPRSRVAMHGGLAARATRLFLRGQAFRERPRDAIAPAERDRIRACFSLAPSLTLSDLVRSIHFYLQGYELALRAGDAESVAVATAMLGSFFANFGWDGAETMLDRASDLARRLDSPEALGTAAYARGLRAFMDDDWSAALLELEDAHRHLTRVKDAVGLRQAALSQIPTQLRYLDRFVELETRTEQIAAEAREVGNPYTAAAAKVDGAYAALALGRPTEARRALALARQDTVGPGMYVEFASLTIDTLVELYLGRAHAAHRRVESAWPRLRTAGLLWVPAGQEFYGALRVAALLATTAGDEGRGARRARRKARALIERYLAKPRSAYGRARRATLEGTLAHQEGDERGARRALEHAAEELEAAGLPVRAATTRRRLLELAGDHAGIHAVDELLAAHDVADPARWSRAWNPGLAAR